MKKNKEWIRILKFVLFSASAGVIQFGSFALLNEFTSWRYWPCYLISLILSILWNFTFNRRFTFKSNANITRAMILVMAFYAVFTPITTILRDAIGFPLAMRCPRSRYPVNPAKQWNVL